jgi:hypothetical protein
VDADLQEASSSGQSWIALPGLRKRLLPQGGMDGSNGTDGA